MLNSSNFLELSLDEMTVKLSTLENQKEMLKIWIRGEEAQLYRVNSFFIFKSPEQRKAYLSLFSEGDESDQAYIGKRIIFTFNINEVDYFS